MDGSATPRAVEIARRDDGVTGYRVTVPPEALPPVRMRDLAAAWDAARAAARSARWDGPRLFRFERPALDWSEGIAGAACGNTGCTELVLQDADACCWAGAVDRTLGLASAYGISVCLRLLGLVDLMASAPWASAWFELRRDGAQIDQQLLRAAAAAPLTRQGGLDENSLRVRLVGPGGAIGDGHPRILPSGASA